MILVNTDLNGEQNVVAIITETNQMVPINNIKFEEFEENYGAILPIKRTFDYNINASNKLTKNNNLILNKNIDKERIINTKKIKLDYYFYVLFRNVLKNILIKNKKNKKDIENILNDDDTIYNEKLELMNDLLIKIMEPHVSFKNIDPNSVLNIFDCLGLNNKNCLNDNM